MKISKLRVQNFRSHSDFLLEIGEKSTLISGENGSGKTSLLEAIYFALQGTSFRSSDKEILKNDGSKWLRIDLKSADDSIRTVKLEEKLDSKIKKTFEIDGKKSARMPVVSKIPVILFEPDDLQLLSGSPSRRRDFLDRFLMQTYPHFRIALSRYNKALKQRNNLLKRENLSPQELFPWDVMLAEYGAEIISKRLEFIRKVNSQISKVYSQIAGVSDQIEVEYLGKNISKEAILRMMNANYQRDRILGYTDFGPHKHDIQFNFNGKDARNVASRGENRSLVLALKFIETDFLAEMSSRPPIVLLDDVFSELDESRQKMLTSHFSKYQTIITSTNEIEVNDCCRVKI
ncbi:MAG: DNA replication and repair protein RecF [bacterium]|nr:DNA replication and repair protein RecF [bacterium]